MSEFNISAEKSTLTDFNGENFEANLYAPEKIDLTEDAIGAFFAEVDNAGVELIAWPVCVENILTDEDEVYNEELLALLRKVFIEAGNHKAKVLLKPVYNNISVEVVTAAVKHTARRLKKMECIIGCMFPENAEFKDEKVRQAFVDELSQKHEHYKFY